MIHDLKGIKCGHLMPEKVIGSDRYGIIWLCTCDCGNTTKAYASKLRKSHKKSCGCGKFGNNHYKWSGCERITGYLWNSILQHAKQRHLEVSITIQEAWQLFIDQKEKCAITGESISFAITPQERKDNIGTASLDRIDNCKGYTKDNIQWVHKYINYMKMNLSQNDFLYWCAKAADFNRHIIPSHTDCGPCVIGKRRIDKVCISNNG